MTIQSGFFAKPTFFYECHLMTDDALFESSTLLLLLSLSVLLVEFNANCSVCITLFLADDVAAAPSSHALLELTSPRVSLLFTPTSLSTTLLTCFCTTVGYLFVVVDGGTPWLSFEVILPCLSSFKSFWAGAFLLNNSTLFFVGNDTAALFSLASVDYTTNFSILYFYTNTIRTTGTTIWMLM